MGFRFSAQTLPLLATTEHAPEPSYSYIGSAKEKY